MECSPRFIERLRRAWDDGDAVFPLDRRLPPHQRDGLIAAVSPTILADESGDTAVPGTPVEPGDAVVVATSGTTGSPRAVVLTHDAVAASATATSTYLNVSDSDCWYACLPPSHVGGLSVLTRSLLTGTRCIADAGFSVEGYEAAARNGATLVSLVSTALGRVDTSLYRKILLGGSRPPAVVGSNVVTTYGLTESGSGVVYDGMPLPGVDVEIREGVIHLRGPMMMRGYRDGTAPFDGHGWFRTGDIGQIDATGRLHVDGREGDLIITGGENVWPDTVETRVREHPDVLDCCVAGVDDPEWGQAVHLWIVPRIRSGPALADLRSFVRETLPPWCAPKALHLVTEIPRTSLGKPRRAQLVESL